MNILLACAGALAILVGLVHSVMGEVLIFSRMRTGGRIPTNGGRLIGEGHVRILWASWHALTVLGWLVAALLIFFALAPAEQPIQAYVLNAIVIAMVLASLLVFVGTKARHPGWAGLLAVAVLTWLGSGS